MNEDDLVVRIAARGDGVMGDGRHVALTAPGDRVAADGTITLGPHHQIPPCRHFPRCGGCQLQQLDDQSYSDFVAGRVVGALAAQGLATTVRPTLLSPPRTRRRASLHAEKRGRDLRLGFTEQASHAIVDMHECWVLAPPLFALVAPLRDLLASLIGGRGRAEVQMTLVDQGIDLGLRGMIVEGLAKAEAMTDFAKAHGIARITVDEGHGAETRWEPEPVTVELGGVPVAFPPGAFLQATVEGEQALVAAAQECVGDAVVIADLFAGLGTFALAMDARVYAAEAARDAVLALKSSAGRAQRTIFTEHRDLYRRPLTDAELNRFDAIILDPPRSGAREQIDALACSAVPRIAYISCNPSSFARDAKTLCEGGYTLQWVRPVGQFRWSTHVELAACFTR